jgi:hypothetical protein
MGVLPVIDEEVVEAVEIIQLKDIGRGAVGIAVRHTACIPVISMRHLVKREMKHIVGTEYHHRRHTPLVIEHHLGRMHRRHMRHTELCVGYQCTQ